METQNIAQIEKTAQIEGTAPGSRKEWRFLLWLAIPFVFYLIPLLFGFSWNALGEGHNVLNPPEGYQGRTPDMRITVEAWGASVVVVPFHARLRDYIKASELPLWNPYQGLGQPFAAEGEGNPYFPFSVLRALLPYSLDNYVTFFVYYLSAVFLYLFLHGLGLSEKAAIFGGVTFVMSGALSLHIARPNIADQLCMIPVLFWGAAKAMRKRSVVWYVIFAVVAALHLLGGFIQIAMISAVLSVAFCFVYGRALSSRRKEWLPNTVITVAVFILGNGLAAFYLLPLLEAMRITFNKNVLLLGFARMPFANIIAFFFPLIFGHPFHVNWVPGEWPWVVSWDNLYGFAGTAILLIVVVGYVSSWPSERQRRIYLFFFFSGIFLTLRYLSVAPIAVVNLVPVIGRQSPKHANGLMVFCFVVTAAFAVHSLRDWDYRRGKWLALATLGYFASLLLTLIGQQGGFRALNPVSVAVRFTSVTAFLALFIVAALWLALRWRRLSSERAVILLTAVVLAEFTVYIPLGNSNFDFLEARLGLFTILVASGLLLALNKRLAAAGMFALALVGYTRLVAVPTVGLPKEFNVDKPPNFMVWLKRTTGSLYRTFGVAPDFSSIAGIQDISVVGPLAPKDFLEFVKVISDETTTNDYIATTHFMLAGPWKFSLDQYLRVKPVFDWIGVRYLVLDRAYFNEGARKDHLGLVSGDKGVKAAYQDERVSILESEASQQKAFFSSVFSVRPTQAVILQELKRDPASILGPPKVEASSVRWPNHLSSSGKGELIPLGIQTYRPNFVRLSVETLDAGIIVLKDSYFPGWRATLNGSPTEVIRVNGFVRGVVIPQAGHYDVEFVYRPESFVRGIWLAGLIGLLMISTVAQARQHRVPRWAVLVGSVLIVVFVEFSIQAYFGVSTVGKLISLLSPREGQEAVGDTTRMSALYLPKAEKIVPGVRVVTSSGEASSLEVGQVVLTSASGDLLRLQADGRVVRLVGREGQTLRVANLGTWDSGSGMFGGLDAVYRGRQWVIDSSTMRPANRNSRFEESSEKEPIPGFWTSPGDAGYTATLMQDKDGRFVRIRATRPSSYLVLNGQGLLPTLDGVPVSVRGRIRGQSSGKARLTLYDVVAKDGTAENYVNESDPSKNWTMLTVRAEKVRYPAPLDNFSIGLFGVNAGDWFDVQELSVFVGIVPSAP